MNESVRCRDFQPHECPPGRKGGGTILKKQKLRIFVLFMVASVLLPAYFSVKPSAWAQEPVKLRFGALPICAFPAQIMKETGLDKKCNIDLQITVYPTVQGFYSAVMAGAVDVAAPGWASVCAFVNNGHDWMNVYSANYTTDQILVRPDSKLRTFDDLKGKKVALFGGPVSQTAINFRIIGLTRFGFDPAKEMKLLYGAPALAAGLLMKGEVDAAVLLEPVVTKLLIPGKAKILAGINNLYREETGGTNLLQLAIAARGGFARKNPEALRCFIKAYMETGYRIRTSARLRNKFARTLLGDKFVDKMTDAQIREFVHRAVTFESQWNAGFVKKLKDFARKGIELAGAEFLPSIPNKAFSLDYIPKGFHP